MDEVERVCWCCGASRDQSRDQMFAEDGEHEPLCLRCWEAEYLDVDALTGCADDQSALGRVLARHLQ
jgi:hypothetical protein